MSATAATDLDRAVDAVARHKDRWLAVGVPERQALLRQCLAGFVAVADDIAVAGCRTKGLDPTTAAGAEEWFSGPIPVIRNLRLLVDTLADVGRFGRPHVRNAPASPDGNAVVTVFPHDAVDRLLYRGMRIDVWLQTPEIGFVPPPARGRLVLVLGAGNVSSIGPMDVLYKLFVENSVAVLKMHPSNAAAGPSFELARIWCSTRPSTTSTSLARRRCTIASPRRRANRSRASSAA